MSLIALVFFAGVGTFVLACLGCAAYASLPERFLTYADRGRYSGLASTTPANRGADRAPL